MVGGGKIPTYSSVETTGWSVPCEEMCRSPLITFDVDDGVPIGVTSSVYIVLYKINSGIGGRISDLGVQGATSLIWAVLHILGLLLYRAHANVSYKLYDTFACVR